MRQPSSLDSVNTIRTFWYGSQLSVYELLCLSSFTNKGHEVELYSYEDLNVPAGVRLCDANEIIDRGELFFYTTGHARGGINAFSDLFRYALLYLRGGTWVDTDVLCLRSFSTLPINCVGFESENYVAIGVMKFEKEDPICQALYEKAKAFDKQQITWSEIGPDLVTNIVKNNSRCHILPPCAFYPIPWFNAWKLIDPSRREECERVTESSFCVHWWNDIFRQVGLPKQALPPKGSYLYQQAKINIDCTGFDAWPEPLVAIWVKNYRNSQLLSHPDLNRPVTTLLKTHPRAIIKDVLSILGAVGRRVKNV